MCDLASEAEYTEATSLAWSWIVKNTEGRFLPQNITFDHRVMLWKDFASLDKTGYATAATIPVLAIAREMRNGGGTQADGWGARYPFPSRISPNITDHAGNTLQTRQPRVAIQCVDQTINEGANATSYGYRVNPSPGLYLELNFRVNKSIFVASENRSTSELALPFGFVDLKDTLPIRTSAMFWIWDKGVRQTRGPTLCLIDARWVDSDLWIMPQNGETPVFSYKLERESLDATQNAHDIIDLDVAWLESLNAIPVSVLRNATTQRFDQVGMFDYMYGDIWSPSNGAGPPVPENRTQISLTAAGSWSMTVILTNLLSAIPRTSGYGVHATGKSIPGPFNATLVRQTTAAEGRKLVAKDLLAQESYARIGPTYEHNIYEYNFDGRTTKLAWAVLLTHVLLVLIHFVVTCVHGNWHSSAWSQLGDLLTLAMNTRPTELLRNTVVAVKDWDIWRLTAYVRVHDGDSVGLELRNKADSGGVQGSRYIPEVNRTYGWLDAFIVYENMTLLHVSPIFLRIYSSARVRENEITTYANQITAPEGRQQSPSSESFPRHTGASLFLPKQYIHADHRVDANLRTHYISLQRKLDLYPTLNNKRRGIQAIRIFIRHKIPPKRLPNQRRCIPPGTFEPDPIQIGLKYRRNALVDAIHRRKHQKGLDVPHVCEVPEETGDEYFDRLTLHWRALFESILFVPLDVKFENGRTPRVADTIRTEKQPVVSIPVTPRVDSMPAIIKRQAVADLPGYPYSRMAVSEYRMCLMKGEFPREFRWKENLVNLELLP